MSSKIDFNQSAAKVNLIFLDVQVIALLPLYCLLSRRSGCVLTTKRTQIIWIQELTLFLMHNEAFQNCIF